MSAATGAGTGDVPPAGRLPGTVDGDYPADPDALYLRFEAWASGRGLDLYPAQAESLIELVSGAHVVLSTPTGTGKSLVAIGAHYAALAAGTRTYYTAPIKALVSEKFFALTEIFGPENVGMVTGDSAVNPDAPLVCATAEIVANIALRRGARAEIGQVVMDEFHYYAEPERGWAWQVPLLVLENTQFLLMSATLGDVDTIATDLERRSGRRVALVTGVERPVPLEYEYSATPVHETMERLLAEDKAPVYIVHFSQAAALEQAQALAGAGVADRARRDAIAAELAGFRFLPGFGATLSRLVKLGIGVHHAGMLPKYRRLVEQLAQRGLLRVICGTDTLGVGINVPIRTVLVTSLAKFDGVRMRRLNAREFHQVAGRAGRAGYDTAGTVLVQAPEHEIENRRALAKAGDDPKKRRKVVKKKPPAGAVNWSEATFTRLVAAEPETLTSRMRITAAMLINVIARGTDAYRDVYALVFDNHEPWKRQLGLARRALGIYRTLVTAGIVERTDGGGVRLTVDLQENFALNQPLSPFALAAFELLDPDAPGEVGTGDHALDIVSVLEATLDDPHAVLRAQEHEARGEAVAEMKRDGIDYEQRMELLDEVTYPRPLAELLEQAFETFAAGQPWVRDFDLAPKSVVRDMFERAMTFREYVAHYRLARSEGTLLRYLSNAYRAALQTIPESLKTEPLRDLIEWLGALVRQVDSSLLDEWEELAHPDAAAHAADTEIAPPAPPRLTENVRAFRVLVRNELFRRVQAAALGRYEEAASTGTDADGAEGEVGVEEWARAMADYHDEHDELLTGADARSAAMLLIDDEPGRWRVRQIFDDPAGDHDWGFSAVVDLAASDAAGEPVVRVTSVGRL